MVKLTLDLIARGTSGYTKKKRDEGIQHYLRRLTHLYLEGRNIDEIGDDLSSCRNLAVLYLYDNKLLRVPNLLSNGNITHLYLQNNKLAKIEYLNGLHRLQKLYLGGNAITVLEGLEKLEHLQELHIENQRLPAGEKLLFDPRTIVALSRCVQILNVSGNGLDSIRDLEILGMLTQFMRCVQILNVSGNGLDSIRDLEILGMLTQFMASDNHLNDMKEMAHCLSSWRYLWKLELVGNPLCHKAKYKDRLIIMAPNLGNLDGKEVTDTAKQFLQNWQANKEAVKRKRELISRQNEMSAYHGLGDENGDLPPLSHMHVKQIASVPGYIMPGLPRKQFQDVLAKSMSQPSSAAPGPRLGLGGKTMSDFAPPRSTANRMRSAPAATTNGGGGHDRFYRPYRAVYHIYPEAMTRSTKPNLVHLGGQASGDTGVYQ